MKKEKNFEYKIVKCCWNCEYFYISYDETLCNNKEADVLIYKTTKVFNMTEDNPAGLCTLYKEKI
jgi:hypothetical protein